MNREERIKRQMSGWLRRTNFSFGNARAGGARVSQHAIEHMRRKPYTVNTLVGEKQPYTNQMMVREEATANE